MLMSGIQFSTEQESSWQCSYRYRRSTRESEFGEHGLRRRGFMAQVNGQASDITEALVMHMKTVA